MTAEQLAFPDPAEEPQRRTYRERREAKAARLREWAGKREVKAEAAYNGARQTADLIPLGQPVLLGHHSQRRHQRDLERIDAGYRRSFEHARKAEEMSRKAANIEAAAAHAIYSDDADAIERLEERIGELEAERDRIKAYNASCRKAAKTGGTGDVSLLDEKQRANLASVARVAAFQIGAGGAYPRYALTNLGGNITRNRKRLEELRRRAGGSNA